MAHLNDSVSALDRPLLFEKIHSIRQIRGSFLWYLETEWTGSVKAPG